MPKKQIIQHCPKCKTELGMVSCRYASMKCTVRRIPDFYYCNKCNKFFKLKQIFDEVSDALVSKEEQ